MPNLQQNDIQNEIGQINKKINLLQDRLKKNLKSQNQFQNGLMHIARIRVKKGQRTDLFQTKKNTKYSEKYIEKQNRANQKEHKSTAKYTCTTKKKRDYLKKE